MMVLSQQQEGAAGRCGPLYANTTWWWQVNFARGADGWVKEPMLKETVAGMPAGLP